MVLAQHYGLDTDLVHERQWRRSSKSGVAIQVICPGAHKVRYLANNESE